MSLCLPTQAQGLLSGYVIDAQTKDSIPMASVVYKTHKEAVVSSIEGRYTIQKRVGWALTFSAVGYISQTIQITDRTPMRLDIRLKPDTKMLKGVTVRAKRQRYSRKNNPAVELMRKVIEHKKMTDLANNDFYQYNKYQKLTMAANEITPEMLQNPKFKNKKWLTDQVENCPYNNKLILPLSVDETVTKRLYRRRPHDEKNIIIGQSSTGIGDLFQTGDIITTMLKDVFTDVNIYDDQIRLLQYPFTSPIGKGAIGFYRFYIEDTVKVDRDSCIHLQFLPNNQQDFGFRGDIYILKDSSYQVKRCQLTIPRRSDVNFVENLRVDQEFTQLPNGEWVLSVDDMIVEMKIASFLHKIIVIRNTRLTDYAFDELPKQLFKGKKKDVREADAMMRGDAFWAQYRQVELTKGENSMDAFIKGLQNIKGFKYIIFGAKALIENFVETGNPSKVDIGPINTMISNNFVDGMRLRASAQTTANLNKHWFFSGYYAHGMKSHKNYYKGEVTYSFNKKEYLPREFPKRTLSFTSTYDVMSPSDKFMHTDKDNVFTAFKWSKVDAMMFYNRQQITFEREEDFGFKTTFSIKTEDNEACGNLRFTPMNEYTAWKNIAGNGEDNIISPYPTTAVQPSHHIRTTEIRAALEYCPGATYINTKQRRLKINLDAPVFSVSHTLGLKNVLGGDYSYNYTEAGIYKRFWMNSWGKIDCYLKGGIQWEKVPFPLLIMPKVNLSWLAQPGTYTFQLMNNMEFLTDRYAMWHVSWDLNGKLFNRIPLLKMLKWREYISVRGMVGKLTDKNNPFLEQNRNDDILFQFPEGCNVMDNKPYVEIAAGIHNIFKFLEVDYIHRMTYKGLDTAIKNGVRFAINMSF